MRAGPGAKDRRPSRLADFEKTPVDPIESDRLWLRCRGRDELFDVLPVEIGAADAALKAELVDLPFEP